jgi:NitT/TauT family transport system permease protein
MVGIPIGVLMARVASLGKLVGIWVNIFVSAPISALVPILMSVIGIGESTVVVTVFLFAVFVIIIDTQVGIKQADRSLVEMARSFGATRRQLYTKVLLLSALPEILAGVRLGVIRGVKGVVIGQLLIAIIGVGELFELYSQNFLMEEFWALVIIVFTFAFVVSEAIAFLERRVEYYASSR